MSRSTVFSRRTLIVAGTALVALHKVARADQGTVKEAIGAAEGDTAKFSSLVQELDVSPSTDQAQFVVGEEFRIVSGFLERTSSFPTEDFLPFIRPEFAGSLEFALAENVDLAPPPNEVEPLPVEPVETSEDSLVGVIVDIILDTLGLESFKSEIKEFVESYPPLRDNLNAISQAVIDRDWTTLLDLLNQMLGIIVAEAAIDYLIQLLGPEKAAALRLALLKQVIKRLVPYLGWALLAAGLLFALKNNWENIRKFL